MEGKRTCRIVVWPTRDDALAASLDDDPPSKVCARMTVHRTYDAARTAQAEEAGGGGYVGPLDIVSGATVAYSQRRLAAAFAGNVIEINNGTASQSFAANTNDAVDPAAVTSFIAGGTGTLAKWYDQSGNGFVLDNGEPQPKWAVVDGFPALGDVDASSMYTTSEVTFLNGAATVFMVCKYAASLTSLVGTEMNFNTSNFVRFQLFNKAVQDIYDDDTGNEISADYEDIPASSEYQLWDGAWSLESGHSMLVDGVPLTPTSIYDTAEPPPSITDLLIMSFGNVGDFLVEIIMYDTVLSNSGRDAIRQNIAAYYGISI